MIINANSGRIPLADKSVHMAVTSPPFYGLRKYAGEQGVEWPAVTYTPMPGLAPLTIEVMRSELGLEPTPEAFVGHIVAVFREVWRVLRDDGTLWLNFGDSYMGNRGNTAEKPGYDNKAAGADGANFYYAGKKAGNGLKDKDLCGIPWRVAFALQADGWYLRNDIIWHKPNPMPESVTDRCTKSHEYLFLLAKSPRYFYDAEAVKEGASESTNERDKYRRTGYGKETRDGKVNHLDPASGAFRDCHGTRNRRTVWTIPTRAYSGAHFATFPPALVAPCILAGTSRKGVCRICGAPFERVVKKRTENRSNAAIAGTVIQGKGHTTSQVRDNHDIRNGPVSIVDTTGWRPTCSHDADPIPATVLDPFAGSCTTGEVCRETGRKFVGLDIGMTYLQDLGLPRAENKQTRASVAEMPLFATMDLEG